MEEINFFMVSLLHQTLKPHMLLSIFEKHLAIIMNGLLLIVFGGRRGMIVEVGQGVSIQFNSMGGWGHAMIIQGLAII